MYWVIIANTNHYKIYEYEKKEDSLKLIEEEDEPLAKKHIKELEMDKPGRFKSNGFGYTTTDERADVKNNVIEVFLKKIADKCEQARNDNHIEKVILLAPARVNGIFFKHVNKHLEPLINNAVKQDCTHFKDRELRNFLHYHWKELYH